MSAKAIREVTAKGILNRHLESKGAPKNTQKCQFIQVDVTTRLNDLEREHEWLKTTKLVVKPDELIKRRGKLGLIGLDLWIPNAIKWINDRQGTYQTVGKAKGKLRHFIIEKFVPHKSEEDAYVCIYSERDQDVILFSHEGGVDIGNVEDKAERLDVPVTNESSVTPDAIKSKLLTKISNSKQQFVAEFINALYKLYVELYFTYLEINPLVITDTEISILDVAAKLDATAEFTCRKLWGKFEYPPPFGRELLPEEAFIADLDAKSGSSLKLTVLNRNGRIWTMVAGGGASVIYSDTICDLGGASELANYGEYSGAPTEGQTYEYAKTILTLMTKSQKHPKGKVLIIGGGIANFTNVASTFSGIIRALNEFQDKLIEHNVSIFVRRAGPNYQEGLRRMRELSKTLGVLMHVYGPELHMTAVCGMALGTRHIEKEQTDQANASFLLPSTQNEHNDRTASPTGDETSCLDNTKRMAAGRTSNSSLFSNTTKSIVLGIQARAVQSMIDFDYICRRDSPSVVAMSSPLTNDHKQKFYWGHKEILIPVYRKFEEAVSKHNDADVLVNFSSLRSAYESTLEALEYPQIRTIAIIAEGIPENLTRQLIVYSKAKNVTIIGPATVGGLKAGCFKIGNTGGMMDNILYSQLHRPGSVAYVTRSGGMSNEMNNIISHHTDGVYEGIAIGGDRYPGTTFLNHLKRFEDDPEVKLLVMLGEVGGREEYDVCAAIKSGRLTKPLVAWCIGTCATEFETDVQFGHAGSSAHNESETAQAKNKALQESGARVPESFDSLGDFIGEVYDELVKAGKLDPKPYVKPPTMPMDYSWAKELGLIRKPTAFMSSICDDRGQELIYANMKITEVLSNNIGIGGVISLLWFQRTLPPYVLKFFEMCLIVCADHGPAVSGAHNTIVCARAGKDLVSSLVSGLLTIGDRFGGALDGAAKQFSEAYDAGWEPIDFVNQTRKQGRLIMGIGHRIKSVNNPDMRVKIIKDFVMENFPAKPLLEYALEVEKITTSKKPNLILNVDGVIATAFVDMLRHCGAFTSEEAQEYIDIGTINSLFVLGRTTGFIGHYLDQKRLRQGLYRHPWDDITYLLPEKKS
ncbi:ATP-citrate synthase-like isoform X2 [Chrysoperla carnea]|uniref:ATP-citrate synthase-like isoform X2 n=1 Tax=Chrysoperla carnea TaxID=189513 RepID=UPI001D072939|nr:ATP-citrate synthase-like isoform X2 [Chrysoperla carnea]